MMMMMWTSDINRAWKSIRENINPSATESLGCCNLKQHKPWFDGESSKLLDQRKQAKLQWLQNRCQTSGDFVSNIRQEASRRSRNKKGSI